MIVVDVPAARSTRRVGLTDRATPVLTSQEIVERVRCQPEALPKVPGANGLGVFSAPLTALIGLRRQFYGPLTVVGAIAVLATVTLPVDAAVATAELLRGHGLLDSVRFG